MTKLMRQPRRGRMTGAVPLDAVDLTDGVPVLGEPVIHQVHVIAPVSLAASSPLIGTPAIARQHVLAATGIAASTARAFPVGIESRDSQTPAP